MKIEGKPIITMEAALTLSHADLEMLQRLCTNRTIVIEAIVGKNAIPDKTEAWLLFFGQLQTAIGEMLQRFNSANAVLQGKKPAREGAKDATGE